MAADALTPDVAMAATGDAAPPTASCRAYLRAGLPAIYQDNGFGMRFLGALETLLDPIVAVLDSLPAHFDAELAPEGLLDLLAAWLGLEVDESTSEQTRRELVRVAADLARRRGTKAGLERHLELAFPELSLRLEDDSDVNWTTDPDARLPRRRPEFVVHADRALNGSERARLIRTIEQMRPVHVGYQLLTSQRDAG
jgi:phage tail-like protein